MDGKNFKITLQKELPIDYICGVYEIMRRDLYRNIYVWSDNKNVVDNYSEKEKLFTMFVGGLLLAQYQLAFLDKDKQICDRYMNDAWKELYILLRPSLV